MVPLKWYENPTHPLWIIIRQVVVMVPLAAVLALGYHNGWSPQDWTTLMTALGTLGIFDIFKLAMTKNE